MVLQMMSPADLAASEQAEMLATQEALQPQAATNLAAHIRGRYQTFHDHRNSQGGWNERLLKALRMFKGEYDPMQLAEIQRFGGSTVYARMVAVKARGATSLLRDVYLTQQRPWAVEPTPDPAIPEEIATQVQQMIMLEVQMAQASGQQVTPDLIQQRFQALMMAAREASIRTADQAAKIATEKLDDLLVEGGFYKALAAFLVDLPLFPFAVMKGPVVRMVEDMRWVQGTPQVLQVPRMFWERVSPFDLYWTPGVSAIEDAEIIERQRITRAGLNQLLGVPGYDEAAIRGALRDYGRGGLKDWLETTESERAIYESRENPWTNSSHMIDMLEFHGPIQGVQLLEHGFDPAAVPDPDRDYLVQAWLVGQYVIKAQLSPNPRKRHPYYITSFEKVPGTVVGNSIPDILDDVQDVANAALRALVNNMAMASGPQVAVDIERLADGEDPDEIYPWKRWQTITGNLGSGQQRPPVEFFQPTDNAQSLLVVYKEMTNIADELSAIPRYITGTERLGGAGRTASGLSMLMGNASKILQTVAANIDNDVINPVLVALYDMVMLVDQSGLLRGDENIRVRGVEAAIQKETERQRAMELLQVTANPIDMQIMGIPGRGKLLRHVVQAVGADGRHIVPTDEQLAMKEQMMLQAQAQMGPEEGEPGGGPPGEKPKDPQGPRTNLQQDRKKP